ncbi:MAG: glycosyltransferase [Acidimicrobiales bacterium]|nr:glycosyltransferase [Acidimicrobiales bacterium]
MTESLSVAVVAPSAVPFNTGGAERAVAGLVAAIDELSPHRAEVFKLPVDERTLPGVIAGYQHFSLLDLKHFDRVISVKYPAWMVGHPAHTVLMFHPLRGLYDTYPAHLPTEVTDPEPVVEDLLRRLSPGAGREALPDVFGWFGLVVDKLGADHPALAFPGPLARRLVHWLDGVALAPGEIVDHAALSATVAARPGYFPNRVTPRVVYLPSDLPPGPDLAEGEGQRHFFTASRLDGPKRLDLVVEAMAHVRGDVALVIAGEGPDGERLRALAAGDDRIRFAGYLTDDELRRHYAEALAVPFVPLDEDLGLITLEAMGRGVPVVTTTDSGGPTEFVDDGVNGLVVEPTAEALGAALDRLAADPIFAARLGTSARHSSDEVTWEGAVESLVGTGSRANRKRHATTGPVGRPAPERGASGRPRVVIPATFPIHNPVGGGQLRARHLYGGMARHLDVEVVALVDWNTPPTSVEIAPGLVETLVPRTAAARDACLQTSLEVGVPVADIVSGHEPELTPGYISTLAAALDGADAVVLAEPYLVRAVEQAVTEAGIPAPPVVLDAYNVEAALKERILPETELGQRLMRWTVAIEAEAVSRAAKVVACGEIDAADLAARYERSPSDVTVITNGAEVPAEPASQSERNHRAHEWLRRYHRTGPLGDGHTHLGLFVGSWHPPNVDAVWMLTELADALPHLLIVSAGSIGDAFYDRVVPPNMVFTGVITDASRRLLLRSAHVALNPMRLGSGTNLKLVEYLSNQIPTVSTPFGARGLDVVDGTHLRLAEPEGFAAAIDHVLTDADAAARMARAGRDLVATDLAWPVLADQLTDLVTSTAGIVL